ncbi:MAG: PrgI family mobile element protein [Coprobacillus cateniformis]
MEVKVNKEIRNYTESIYFGLSLRQFIFFYSVLPYGSWIVFYNETLFWIRNIIMALYFRSFPICGIRFYYL